MNNAAVADPHQELHLFAVEILSKALLPNHQVELLIANRITPQVFLQLSNAKLAQVLGGAVPDAPILHELQSLASNLLFLVDVDQEEEEHRVDAIPKPPAQDAQQASSWQKIKRLFKRTSMSRRAESMEEESEIVRTDLPKRLSASMWDLRPSDFSAMLVTRGVITELNAMSMVKHDVDFAKLTRFFHTDEDVELGVEDDMLVLNALLEWTEREVERMNTSPQEFAKTLRREQVITAYEADMLAQLGLGREALAQYSAEDFERTGFSPVSAGKLLAWFDAKRAITVETPTVQPRQAKNMAERIGELDLDAEEFAELLVVEELLTEAESQQIIALEITLQRAMGDITQLQRLSAVKLVEVVEYVKRAVRHLPPAALGRLLMHNQVKLNARQASAFQALQIRYSSFKHYNREGLAELGISSALTRERALEWIRVMEGREKSPGLLLAMPEQLSVYQFTKLLLSLELVREFEAERLVQFGCNFHMLKLSDAEALEEMGITSTVTQQKLLLWCRTRDVTLTRALDVIKGRWRVSVREDLLVALGGSENAPPVLLAFLRDEAVSLQAVEMLLQSPHGVQDVARCPALARGETLLHLAAKAARISPQLIKLLLDERVDVNARDECGNTALMLASKCGNVDTVKQLLLREETDAGLVNFLGFSALNLAVQFNAPRDIILLLASRNSGGGDANAGNRTFPLQTPLWCAVERNNAQTVRALLECGADVRLAHHALSLCAQRNGGAAVARALIEHGGRRLVFLPNAHGLTPLRLLAQQGNASGNRELMRVLVRAGAKVVELDGTNLLSLCRSMLTPAAAMAAATVEPPAITVLKQGLASQGILFLLPPRRRGKVRPAIHRLPPELIRVLTTFMG